MVEEAAPGCNHLEPSWTMKQPSQSGDFIPQDRTADTSGRLWQDDNLAKTKFLMVSGKEDSLFGTFCHRKSRHSRCILHYIFQSNLLRYHVRSIRHPACHDSHHSIYGM